MKSFMPAILLAGIMTLFSFHSKTGPGTIPSPLTAYSSTWDAPHYKQCNTAADANYMSSAEKEIIYILNMARMNPELFARTVVQQYPAKTGRLYLRNIHYYTSLLDTMKKYKPVNLLTPDSLCFVSAKCHAISSGQASYVGHTRRTEECKKTQKFSAECCEYGNSKPLDIIMALLIDEGVPSLGHRYACLDSYQKIGVSIQPHKGYGTNTVLDFSFR